MSVAKRWRLQVASQRFLQAQSIKSCTSLEPFAPCLSHKNKVQFSSTGTLQKICMSQCRLRLPWRYFSELWVLHIADFAQLLTHIYERF